MNCKVMNGSSLRNNLVELLQGGQAHLPAKKILKVLKPALRNVRPSDGSHSIYEEIEHLRIAQEDILRYTLDPSWKSPVWPDGYWPSNNEGLTDAIWDKTIAGFFSDLVEVTDLIQNLKIDLTAEIPHGEGHTYLREILLVADHNSYHLGQIVQTMKTLGAWPG